MGAASREGWGPQGESKELVVKDGFLVERAVLVGSWVRAL
jgi:hypothetical protein